MPYESVDCVSLEESGKAVGWFQPTDGGCDIIAMKN